MLQKRWFDFVQLVALLLLTGCTDVNRTPKDNSAANASPPDVVAPTEPKEPPKPRTLDRPVGPIAVVALDPDLNRSTQEDIFVALLRERNYQVIPRTNIQKILEEEGFQNTGLTDQAIGRVKVTGAEALFVYRRDNTGISYQILDIANGQILHADHSSLNTDCNAFERTIQRNCVWGADFYTRIPFNYS